MHITDCLPCCACRLQSGVSTLLLYESALLTSWHLFVSWHRSLWFSLNANISITVELPLSKTFPYCFVHGNFQQDNESGVLRRLQTRPHSHFVLVQAKWYWYKYYRPLGENKRVEYLELGAVPRVRIFFIKRTKTGISNLQKSLLNVKFSPIITYRNTWGSEMPL